ncbi:MAG: ATP-binding cassette domain-containing protein [Burkholderiales bacterium]|nr:ATP-binding cassette domain-containing protein [Burkholderiales bacterium]OUT76023.1 MAG: ABC transporter ATP-binding protein [Betaproteobacteria bacterium TMED22]|tara:strand:+ start:555 stop:1505 length:951 start_codon:yes stop_codon:yes gene_type:complete
MTDQDNFLTLSAAGLTRKYGNNVAVSDVSLALKKGEIIGLLGPNGAGKSTTMKMITGNLAPTEGSITVCGIDLIDDPITAKTKIGYLPEIPPVYKELRVNEYLKLAAKLHKVNSKRVSSAMENAKERTGLTEMSQRLIGSLSKGFQQRVGIAQAIIHEPEVVILDEPTVGLDPNQIIEIRSLIKELGEHHSVILSTHILPEVEAICDSVQILHKGKVVFDDEISGLRKFRSGKSIQVSFRAPPTKETLENKLTNAKISTVREGVYRISGIELQDDPTDAIVRHSVQEQWGLFELVGAQASVEEVFVELTTQDDTST